MPSEEELLVRHQRKFAVYEEYLRTDTKAPLQLTQPISQYHEQQRQHRTYVSKTVLVMHHDGGRDDW
ncbi:hypothetical_protein (plasmid) [Leishmania braziliensis MHOM/BR/75/M2904]|uniref:Hypothetical_protein n=1 Tax=Leishmania braziliensis MHOM/BR/75/M2904 TaxID=420245 RepID=A0A3P3Z210_LEIBR|nr:unnamed protein product [Leishmania braziliensis]CAJ2469800.1 unnamed protein product [Leishmania braziliensis]SYZ64170.1 hypothetical_protein [Leishmania braziliensis MHOM/BR/75/M2904]